MSWQASEAVRLCSKARGARRSVLFCAATFADKDGHNSRAKITTLMAGAGVARDTTIKAVQDALEGGEITRTGTRASGTHVYSLAPLVNQWRALGSPQSSSAIELTAVQPLDRQQSSEQTVSVQQVDHSGPVAGHEPSLTVLKPSGNRPLAAEPPSELQELVEEIFDFWVQVTDRGSKTFRLTPPRREAIEKGLGHYEAGELKEAIGHWRNSPFHRGENKTRKVFNDLPFLLKDDAVIEELRDATPGHRETVRAVIAEQFGELSP